MSQKAPMLGLRRRHLLAASLASLATPPLAAQQRIIVGGLDGAPATVAGGQAADELLQAQIDISALGRMPGSVMAPSVDNFWTAPRTVWLTRSATRQAIRTVWWRDGQVVPQAYQALSLFLGDPRMERRIQALRQQHGVAHAGWYHAVWVAPVVLDILYALTAWLEVFGMSRPIEVTSAFRHPITNAFTEGAARDSLHQLGAAVDVMVPGVPPARVAQFGAWMRGGGVGVYPSRGFTHLDAGRVRSWQGR